MSVYIKSVTCLRKGKIVGILGKVYSTKTLEWHKIPCLESSLAIRLNNKKKTQKKQAMLLAHQWDKKE